MKMYAAKDLLTGNLVKDDNGSVMRFTLDESREWQLSQPYPARYVMVHYA